MPKFRRIVLSIFSIDIYKEEGLWFSNVDFCLENGISVKKFIQKAGDIVFLNSGTLHWVRSKGITVNSAWNVALKSLFGYSEMFKRLKINTEIGFKSIIPVKTLVFELIKQEFSRLDKGFLAFCIKKLKKFAQKKESRLFEKEPFGSKVFFCDICSKETFDYWVYCEDKGFFCVECGNKHEKSCKNKNLMVFYEKNGYENLIKFIENIEEFIKSGISKIETEKKEKQAILEQVDEEKEGEKYKIKKKTIEKEEMNKVFEHRKILQNYYYEDSIENIENSGKTTKTATNILQKLISFNK